MKIFIFLLKENNMSSYTGVVKWFDNERGYGFISANDGNDVFVHHSGIKEKGTNKGIHEGQEVSFDIVQGEKGPSAINVQKH
jgi:CspA family cold shock protein